MRFWSYRTGQYTEIDIKITKIRDAFIGADWTQFYLLLTDRCRTQVEDELHCDKDIIRGHGPTMSLQTLTKKRSIILTTVWFKGFSEEIHFLLKYLCKKKIKVTGGGGGHLSREKAFFSASPEAKSNMLNVWRFNEAHLELK